MTGHSFLYDRFRPYKVAKYMACYKTVCHIKGLRFNKPLILIETSQLYFLLDNSYQLNRKLTSGQAWTQRTV